MWGERNLPNWVERCQFWILQTAPKVGRKRREREQHPLLLTGHGLSLRVDQGCLFVRDGHTHYPANRREWRFFAGSLEIPPSIVIVDGSGNITMDAIDWLARQRVPLVRLRWNGEFASVVTSGGQAASVDRIRWQVKTRDDPNARIEFGRKVVLEKALSTLSTMQTHLPRSLLWNRAHRNITTAVDTLRTGPSPKSIHVLLGIEGGIAADYFLAWTEIELKWRATKKDAIPSDWRKYRTRSAHRVEQSRNYRATHPVNAMLNYAYGVLTARTHIALMASGYDPNLGIVHENAQSRGLFPNFVLDSMEPMRPVVDRAVLELISDTILIPADFSIQHDGTCRVNPELARRVAQLAIKHCETMELPSKLFKYQRSRVEQDKVVGT
jgi:CRISP-associated protein Cas1